VDAVKCSRKHIAAGKSTDTRIKAYTGATPEGGGIPPRVNSSALYLPVCPLSFAPTRMMLAVKLSCVNRLESSSRSPFRIDRLIEMEQRRRPLRFSGRASGAGRHEQPIARKVTDSPARRLLQFATFAGSCEMEIDQVQVDRESVSKRSRDRSSSN